MLGVVDPPSCPDAAAAVDASVQREVGGAKGFDCCDGDGGGGSEEAGYGGGVRSGDEAVEAGGGFVEEFCQCGRGVRGGGGGWVVGLVGEAVEGWNGKGPGEGGVGIEIGCGSPPARVL